MLREHGHSVYPVSPKLKELAGIPAVSDLAELKESIDTLTMYVGPTTSSTLTDAIVQLHPRRVIFNPGSENPTLAQRLRQESVEVIEACTLVMLRTGQF